MVVVSQRGQTVRPVIVGVADPLVVYWNAGRKTLLEGLQLVAKRYEAFSMRGHGSSTLVDGATGIRLYENAFSPENWEFLWVVGYVI